MAERMAGWRAEKKLMAEKRAVKMAD